MAGMKQGKDIMQSKRGGDSGVGREEERWGKENIFQNSPPALYINYGLYSANLSKIICSI